MTNEQHHPEHAQEAFLDALFEESPLNLAALLRACADGELSPAQCERLKQIVGDCPVTPSCIAFDQALRDCCGRAMREAMRETKCPDALRERITAIAASSSIAQTTHAPSDHAQHPETTSRSFWARSPMLAIAAMVMLSLAGVLIWQASSLSGIFTPTVPLNIDQVSYSERVGQFALREHNRCSQDGPAQAKLDKREITQAVAYFSQRFDRPVQMPDMAQGEDHIQFFGGGDCHLPETVQSGHLRFDAYDDAGNPISLSLFIAPDPGILPLEQGVTYKVSSEACDAVGARLFVWAIDGVQYLLVSEASDTTCASVRGLMNAPKNIKQL